MKVFLLTFFVGSIFISTHLSFGSSFPDLGGAGSDASRSLSKEGMGGTESNSDLDDDECPLCQRRLKLTDLLSDAVFHNCSSSSMLPTVICEAVAYGGVYYLQGDPLTPLFVRVAEACGVDNSTLAIFFELFKDRYAEEATAEGLTEREKQDLEFRSSMAASMADIRRRGRGMR